MLKQKKIIDPNNFYFYEAPFHNLMKKRIDKVLLICSSYDAFILEEDGRINEQIFNEYVSLNLRYPPQFVQVPSSWDAFAALEKDTIDLVITMLSAVDMDSFVLAKQIKAKYPEKPIVILTPFSREVSLRMAKHDLSAIDYVFCWLGNADILLAIIKLIEDKINVEEDVISAGVHSILLVEDSVRFYSSYLPNIYKIILKQSQEFMQEGLNEHQRMLRMRGRPKILLATNYDQAVQLYDKYKDVLLGVITDMSYPREGKKDEFAGIKLCKKIKEDDKLMPLLLQSSDERNRERAKEIQVGFICKNSKTLLPEIRAFITEYFAFGDFVFKDQDSGFEVDRARDLKSLQEVLETLPNSSLEYHVKRNHFSKWLRARALFPIAQIFREVTADDFKNVYLLRRFLIDTISNYRRYTSRGVIAQFYKEKYDEHVMFARIGQGFIGGKARGLAFLDTLIKKYKDLNDFDDVTVTIPRTVVLSTEAFDAFMHQNDLFHIALSDRSDDEIFESFITATLPTGIYDDLYAFLTVVKNPIAVRSSSLLEDSHYQPFAGVYSTYMIPNSDANIDMNMKHLSLAIKSVYASVYFKGTKAYMAATSNVIDEEKMGVVLQEVCGKQYGDRFYPTFAGVARSVNFYPIPPEKSEDGIVSIALGLGKYVVEGSKALRFSPKYPRKVLQLSSPSLALQESQKYFYALNMRTESFVPTIDDSFNLEEFRIVDAEKDNSIKNIASTFDIANDMLYDGVSEKGKKVITFANVLKYNVFPLAAILTKVLEIGQKEMNNPIEIEFAVELDVPAGSPRIFNLLQIRPIVENNEVIDTDLDEIPNESTIITSNSVLGNGSVKDIYDFVYVKPETFNNLNTQKIVYAIERLNDKFVKENKNYVLVGPGRWGSSDHYLGIPVKWVQISAARVIVEAGLSNFRIDPSQGTHFFQNLTSFRVGYFTINPYINDGFYDVAYLNSCPSVFEDEYIRHVCFKTPIDVKIDGKKNKGVIMKPKSL